VSLTESEHSSDTEPPQVRAVSFEDAIKEEAERRVPKKTGKEVKTSYPRDVIEVKDASGKTYTVHKARLREKGVNPPQKQPSKRSTRAVKRRPAQKKERKPKQQQKQKQQSKNKPKNVVKKQDKGKEKVELRSVVQNASSYAVAMWKGDPRAEQSVRDLGIPTRQVPSSNGTHCIESARREDFIVGAISSLYQMGYSNIVSLYGSQRDQNIASRLNHKVPLPEQVRVYPLCTRDLVGYNLAPKDAYRKALTDGLPVAKCKAAIIVDVYWLTPESTHQLMADLGLDVVLWIGKAHLQTYGCYYGSTVWYREDQNGDLAISYASDDVIVSKASQSEPFNEPHPCCDWLFRENFHKVGSHYLNWSIVASAPEGAWHRVFFSMQDRPPVCPFTLPYEDVTMEIDIPASLGNTSIFAPVMRVFDKVTQSKQRVLIFKPLLIKLLNHKFGKNVNSYTYAAVHSAAREYCEEDKGLKALQVAYPQFVEEIKRNTVNAAFWSRLKKDAEYLHSITKELGPTISKYQAARKRLDKPLTAPQSTSHFKLVAAALLAGAIGATFVQRFSWLFRSQKRKEPQPAAVVTNHLTKWLLSRYSKVALKVAPYANRAKRAIMDTQYWTTCVLAPVAEENLKDRLGWWGTAAFMLLEAVVVAKKFGPAAYVPVAGIHLACKVLSGAGYMKTAIGVHSLWNHFCYFLNQQQPASLTFHLSHAPTLNSVHGQWVDSYYRQPWPVRPRLDDETQGVYPIYNVGLPRQVRSYTGAEVKLCDRIKFKRFKTVSIAEKPPLLVAGYLVGNCPLYVPARSIANTEVAITQRLLKEAPGDDPLKIYRRWQAVPDFIFKEEYDEISWDEAWPEYYKHLETAQRKQRAKRAKKVVKTAGYGPNDRFFNRASYFVKTNEKLFREEDGRPAMKPRGIVLLRPEAVDTIGPALFQVAERFKKEYNFTNPPVHKFQNRRLRITYASAATAENLTEWMTRAKAWVSVRKNGEKRYWALVAGDDGFIVTFVNGAFLYLATDFSQYDQSEGRGALQYQKKQQRRLGLSKLDAACQERLGKATIKTDFGTLIMLSRWWRQTGEGGTTIGNGMVHAGVLLYAYHKGSHEVMETAYLELGLKVKLTATRDLWAVDFLKGWWIPGLSHQLVWTVLPSRVLKIGQHLGDPRHIRGYSRDLKVACQQHACAVAKTYAAFSWSPIVGGYVKRWKDEFDVEPWRLPSWRVTSEQAYPIDKREARVWAARRYGVDYEEVIHLEKVYREVDVFTFIKHPLFLRMARADY
jgi:hypothetical protein